MSIEIKSDILAKELNQGIVPLGVPKAYQYDAALVEAAMAAVHQGLDDVAEAGATAKAAVEAQGTASVNAVSAQEQASKADVNALGDKILAQMKHGYGYPFTAATAAAMTDTTKIYVYTGSETGYTNGNWYYWNGTAWVSGGVYQATALETDKTLTISGAAADAKVVGDVTVKKRDSYNLFNKNISVPGFLTSEGGIAGTTSAYRTTGYIPVEKNVTIIIKPRLRKFLAYTSSKTVIPSTWVDNFETNYTFTPSQNGYIKFSYAIREENSVEAKLYSYASSSYEPYGEKFIEDNVGFNDFQKEKIYNLSYRNSINVLDTAATSIGYLNEVGNIVSQYTDWRTSDYIYVPPFTSIVFSPRIRKFLAFNTNKEYIADTFVDEYVDNYVYSTTSSAEYVRVSYSVYIEQDIIAAYSSVPVPYEKYNAQYFKDNIDFNEYQQNVIKKISNISGNFLYGKKWVACGDSFTHGDFSDSLTEDYIFTDGKYAGKYKVYPYFIGNRNNMEIVNKAANGMTMGYKDGYNNSFSVNAYTTIDADADYITLYFGINDWHQEIPIGTITDSTNTTFYGAWNMVMEYIITNHPKAKIGIIITNGSTLDYVNAEIAIAEKWGIPYLDMATGVQVPTMSRTNKTLPDSVKNIKLDTFSVNRSAGNSHPNEIAHEYESTFIESFLRRL